MLDMLAFLTTLAQFHSNRSRLIQGVQFNLLVSAARQTEKDVQTSDKCERERRRHPCAPMETRHTSIHYTYFKLSISSSVPLPTDGWIRWKGVSLDYSTSTMKSYKRRTKDAKYAKGTPRVLSPFFSTQLICDCYFHIDMFLNCEHTSALWLIPLFYSNEMYDFVEMNEADW